MQIANIPMAEIFALTAVFALLAAAYEDVLRFEIPDLLSILLLGSAAGYGFVTPGFVWWSHLVAPVVMFGLGLFIFARGWMGGGDVKLLIGMSAWTGLAALPIQLALVALAGGGLALLLIAARAAAMRTVGGDAEALPKIFRKDAPLPYAVAIAAGTLWWGWNVWPIL